MADRNHGLRDPGLAKTALIRELVDLSKFTESILRTLGSAVIAVSDEGLVTYVNPAAEKLLGKAAPTLLQQPAAEVLVTRGGGNLIGDSNASGDGDGEVDLQCADGRIVTVEARLSRQGEETGGGVVAILTDRTDLKRAEQDARRQDRLASLGELSAGVAHEIRNPLAGIGASAQLLRSRLGEDAEHVRLVQLILEEVGRLDRIVENMLQFASPPEPRLVQADMRTCLLRALELLGPDVSGSGIEVVSTFNTEASTLWMDPDQIEQVLLNLFRNAVQSMEETGGTLSVSMGIVSRRPYVRRRSGRREEDRGRLPQGQAPLKDWVEIEITDTGHGISSEDLDRIFNPFYTTRRRGSGLGLSITQAIIHEHGGMISVSSQPGQGTTVLVDLPQDKRQGRRRNNA